MERRTFIASGLAGASAAALSACGTVSTVGTTTDNPRTQRRRKTEADADAALARLYATTRGARDLVSKSRGLLVFPTVLSAGLGIGGEYGEGILRVGGTTVDFYNLASLSVGLQIGAQSKALIFLFMTQDALEKFRTSQGWSVGADASVAVLRAGANGELDITSVAGPVLAFIMTNAGLMANLTLEGTKITRLRS